jgi:hypothetical protein
MKVKKVIKASVNVVKKINPINTFFLRKSTIVR